MDNNKVVNSDSVTWQDQYLLGYEDIDLQHHYFVNLIKRLEYAINHEEDEKYIAALVSELDAYARFHFKSEETMMVHTHYPEYEHHKKQHHDLIERLSVEQYKLLHREFKQDAQNIIHFLVEWFINHTIQVDKEFVHYLKQ